MAYARGAAGREGMLAIAHNYLQPAGIVLDCWHTRRHPGHTPGPAIVNLVFVRVTEPRCVVEVS